LLRHSCERLAAGSPVRRALVALDPTGKQRSPQRMRCRMLRTRVETFGELVAERDTKKGVDRASGVRYSG
jgi:hypothetical protein